jgi:hypothetical protein
MPVMFPGIMRFTGWRKPISISGAGKAVGVILRRRPCFFVQTGAIQAISGGALSRAVPARRSGDHPEATAMTAQLDLLEFPEHPHKGGAQTDDDT